MGIAESIGDGEMTLRIEDEDLILRTADGGTVAVSLSDLHAQEAHRGL